MRTNKLVDHILRESYMYACEHRHPYYTPEHILYVALSFPKMNYLLQKCYVETGLIKSVLEEYFKYNMVPKKDEPYTTHDLTEVLRIADDQVKTLGHQHVEETSLLYSIFALGEDSYASYALQVAGFNNESFLSLYGQLLEDSDFSFNEEDFEEDEFAYQSTSSSQKSLVSQLTVNLTQRAKEGKIEPLIGREKELTRTIHILCRKTKNNPLHVGEPGVGKTAITMGLANAIVQGKVPEVLKGHEVLSLQMSQMVAGTRYRGDFEERIQRFLEEIVKKKNIILFIDEIHTIIGAGSTGSSGQMDASNILKPLLSTGDILCIGATTYEEYEKFFAKDKALLRRFHKIDVEQPTSQETLKILEGLKPYYEKHHRVTYTTKALQSAVNLSEKYLKERFWPDKAIDLMDEAGALTHLSSKKRKFITERDIEVVISQMMKISFESISFQENTRLLSLQSNLENVIYGQKKAIEETVRVIKRSYIGIKKDSRPMGCLLFVGPTGVGKTELSQKLAEFLGINFIRLDMSEYQEKHSVSRLIGSPPGYVGYEEGGLLTDSVRRNPYCVVLLDEVEKAHKDVYSLLLQVMDYATLTDSLGRKADFRNVVLIMTSNLGITDIGKNIVGFGHKTLAASEAVEGSVNKFFKPEFRNRLDKIISFDFLSKDIMISIVRKEISLLATYLMSKSVRLNVQESALEYLAEKSYSPAFGARYVSRVIEENVKDWFVDFFLENSSREGEMVIISYDEGKESLSFQIQ